MARAAPANPRAPARAGPAHGQIYHVFISHASRDWDACVEEIWRSAGRLAGVRVFVAEHGIEPGQDFWLAIFKALTRSDTVLLVWTDNASHSRNVRLEANLAFSLGKQVVPINVDGTELPDYLKHTQYIGREHIQEFVGRRLSTVRESLELQHTAARSKYSVSTDEEEFYDFGSRLLRHRQRRVILMAGTPALILPSEARTPARSEYYQRLSARLRSGRGLDESYYLFKLRRTVRYMLQEDPQAMRGRMASVEGLLRNDLGVRVYGVGRVPTYLPSGILGPDKGAILLRDPWSSERLVGVYFVTGRELESLRAKTYLPLLRNHSLLSEQNWFRLLQSRIPPDPGTARPARRR